jgi:hypothetical protein
MRKKVRFTSDGFKKRSFKLRFLLVLGYCLGI